MSEASHNPMPFRLPPWVPWVIGAGFVAAAAWSGRELLSAREENITLRTEVKLAQLALSDARNRLQAERLVLNQQLKMQGDLAQFKIATLTSMPGHSPPALAVAVWNPTRQEGVLTVDKLSAAPPDQDYELWVIDPQNPQPISGGVFMVGSDGRARIQFKPEAPVRSIAKFAVSREKKGGAPRLAGPQGQVVMISQ